MKLLLDTHVFIWLDTAPEKLSPSALHACQAPENELYLSVASVWEIQIKLRLGKLKLDISLESLIEGQREINQLRILPIELDHIFAAQPLPLFHGDPFDRLLIGQARREDAWLVTIDTIIQQYHAHVKLLW